MQVSLTEASNEEEEDEDLSIIELNVLPPPSITPSTSQTATPSAIQDLFTAVSNCSNLHPDLLDEDDDDMDGEGGDSRIRFEGSVGYEGISGLPGVSRGAADGGLPPPFPGSGGWITAENVGEFFDADGNWIGGQDGDGAEAVEVLGDGAGRVRGHDEVDDVNGDDADGEDSKWRRTD
jgi:nucleotide-sensitive chloride channel 1A